MLLRYLLKTLALPPALNLLLILLALLFLQRWKGLRNGVIGVSVLSLAIVCMPVTSHYLAAGLERYPALNIAAIELADYEAIVVIGGGRHRGAPEYQDHDIPNARALERLRYAAYLQRRSGLPILVAGGSVWADEAPEAFYMQRVLEREFFATVRWRESASRTTWENARLAKKMLAAEDVDGVLLVTHAMHMPRALYSFRQAGFRVRAAPTIFTANRMTPLDVLDFVPQASALYLSVAALHEWLGMAWYRYRYG